MDEKVQRMIDNPGLYVVAGWNRHLMTVIWSIDGKLHPMEVETRTLDPLRFEPDLTILHGPLT